ncbi:MAG TPA: hypothetical protein HPP87_04680 [Planctomycetes bacterium]|nr:hypothetical protein [Planctomycetota bacterium]
MKKNPKRHPVLLPDDLWARLCREAGRRQAKEQRPVSPAQLAREILIKDLKTKN